MRKSSTASVKAMPLVSWTNRHGVLVHWRYVCSKKHDILRHESVEEYSDCLQCCYVGCLGTGIQDLITADSASETAFLSGGISWRNIRRPVLDSIIRTISSPCAIIHRSRSGPLSALMDVTGVPSLFMFMAVKAYLDANAYRSGNNLWNCSGVTQQFPVVLASPRGLMVLMVHLVELLAEIFRTVVAHK